jgi:hypothetical protein
MKYFEGSMLYQKGKNLNEIALIILRLYRFFTGFDVKYKPKPHDSTVIKEIDVPYTINDFDYKDPIINQTEFDDLIYLINYIKGSIS